MDMESLRAAVRAAIESQGAKATAEALGLNIVTMYRFASGDRVHAGTTAQVALKLGASDRGFQFVEGSCSR